MRNKEVRQCYDWMIMLVVVHGHRALWIEPHKWYSPGKIWAAKVFVTPIDLKAGNTMLSFFSQGLVNSRGKEFPIIDRVLHRNMAALKDTLVCPDLSACVDVHRRIAESRHDSAGRPLLVYLSYAHTLFLVKDRT